LGGSAGELQTALIELNWVRSTNSPLLTHKYICIDAYESSPVGVDCMVTGVNTRPWHIANSDAWTLPTWAWPGQWAWWVCFVSLSDT